MKRITRNISIIAFSATALIIASFVFLPGVLKNNTRIKAGVDADAGVFIDGDENIDLSGIRVYKAGEEPRVSLDDGDIAVSVLSGDFDGDGSEEQVIAYRTLNGVHSPIMVTFVEYNEFTFTYTRIYTTKTGATRPATLALYTQDLTGAHKNCILATGMNEQDEKTMSVFMWNKAANGSPRIDTLAEIVTDGSISVEETARSRAYEQGTSGGASYAILVRSRDTSSGNELDQIETTWGYNGAKGLYERQNTVKLPGARIETRTLRDVLGGGAGRFERFVSGLWYHVSAGGTVDNEQYIYFDTENREIIFYGDNTQQVYTWRNSSATRFGIYISSQNISVPTMNRVVDIELESVDSIRVRVFEDVRMRIQVNAPWDGAYRKASRDTKKNELPVESRIQASYTCAWGNIRFFPSGEFEITNSSIREQGNYSFFALENNEILELIPRIPQQEKNSAAVYPLPSRESYRVERTADGALKLYRIRLGTRGIQSYNETPTALSPAGAE
ncbi:MAG: pallilysin-related adhesin [Spirochaetaceae bacterium]|jgi:hypothetical protein|nr:pallilysin-related adhesin [Spirochaetaceae bacterium]